MDVVQRLLDERKQSYSVVKKNCVRIPIVTDHCEDCHDLQTDVQHYNDVSLNIPPEPPPNVYHHIDDEWQKVEEKPTPPPPINPVQTNESESETDREDESVLEVEVTSESEQEVIQNPIQDNTIQEQEPINNNIPLFF